MATYKAELTGVKSLVDGCEMRRICEKQRHMSNTGSVIGVKNSIKNRCGKIHFDLSLYITYP